MLGGVASAVIGRKKFTWLGEKGLRCLGEEGLREAG